MTGEQYYRAHRATAEDFGAADYPPWDKLSKLEQATWEEMAFEQDLRDRGTHARLLGTKGAPTYDGPYSD